MPLLPHLGYCTRDETDSARAAPQIYPGQEAAAPRQRPEPDALRRRGPPQDRRERATPGRRPQLPSAEPSLQLPATHPARPSPPSADERLAEASADSLDAEDTRELLRLGPFARFRDNLRTVAKIEGGADTPALAEGALLTLNAFDDRLVAFKKAEDAAGKEEALQGARREVKLLREKVGRVVELAQKSPAAAEAA